jgi:hypothetical protein
MMKAKMCLVIKNLKKKKKTSLLLNQNSLLLEAMEATNRVEEDERHRKYIEELKNRNKNHENVRNYIERSHLERNNKAQNYIK